MASEEEEESREGVLDDSVRRVEVREELLWRFYREARQDTWDLVL